MKKGAQGGPPEIGIIMSKSIQDEIVHILSKMDLGEAVLFETSYPDSDIEELDFVEPEPQPKPQKAVKRETTSKRTKKKVIKEIVLETLSKIKESDPEKYSSAGDIFDFYGGWGETEKEVKVKKIKKALLELYREEECDRSKNREFIYRKK